MIIDENEIVLEGLKLHLDQRFEVITVSDPTVALLDLGGLRFDLIITDLLMPASSGVGLIASLRQQHPGTPIITMSAWGKPRGAGELKVDTLLLKPFELGELDNSLNNLLVYKVS